MDIRLTIAAEKVRTAPSGKRNTTLFGAAASLSPLVADGTLNRDEVYAALYEAAIAAGLGAAETSRAINSGITKPIRSAAKVCEVCGSGGRLERHHLAPVAVFGDDEAERWPTVMVCVPCHRRWHALMKAPAESRPKRPWTRKHGRSPPEEPDCPECHKAHAALKLAPPGRLVSCEGCDKGWVLV